MNAAELKKAESAKIRQDVWDWFQQNPCHTKGECAAALGHTPTTIGKHCRAIRDGWRPNQSERADG